MQVLTGCLLITASLTYGVDYVAIVDDLVDILSLIARRCQSVFLFLKQMLLLAVDVALLR